MTEKEALALLARRGCSSSVVEHCKAVAESARKIAQNITECAEKRGSPVDIDMEAVLIGGLLHDIGRSQTHGITHAVAGARIALDAGLVGKLVNIIERHIGAGITRDEAVSLGLPAKDYIPETIEEKIVAHADNLISGSRAGTIDELVQSLRKKQLDEKIIQRITRLNDEIQSMMC